MKDPEQRPAREASGAEAPGGPLFRLADAVDDVLWVFSATPLGVRYASPGLRAVWGLEPSDLSRNPELWFERVHFEDRARVRGWLECLATGEAGVQRTMDYRVVLPEGVVKWVRDRGTALGRPGDGPALVAGIARDITQHMRSEEALRASERALEQAQAVAHIGSWWSEPDREGVLIWSKETYRIFGVEEGVFRPRVDSFFALVHPEDRDAIRRAVSDALAGGRAYGLDHRIVRPDGQVRWVHEQGEVVRDARGEPAGLVGVVQDITEQRRASEALRESEARYRTVVASLAEGVVLYDGQGRLVASNAAAAAILGIQPDEFRARALHDAAWMTVREDGSAWPADDFPASRTLRSGEPQTEQVMGVPAPDGSIRWISINTQPIFEAGRAAPGGVVATFIDITPRKRAELRLRESEDRYRSLVEQAPVGIFVNRGGLIAFANARFASMVGAPGPGAVTGMRALDFIHPDFHGVVTARAREVLASGRAAPVLEEKFLRLDGREIDVEVAAARLTYDGEPAVQVTVHDITERKRLERDLLQAQKMDAVGRLASGVAHEFQNLLTAITGYTALAKRTLAAGHPAVQSLDRVEEAAAQAAGVTGSLLTFGRRAGGEKSVVALAAPVERAARLLRRTLPGSMEVAVHASGAGPVWVRADANQVQQAVVNLAINARDAMEGRGRLELTVGPAPGRESMGQVRVADTGRGIEAGVRDRIFEPFFTTKPPGEGTGLGLSIVRSIVEDHGGSVEVQSHPGAGTTVTLLFPRVPPPGGPAPGAAPASIVEVKPPARGRTVVLAGGARHLRELMAGALIGQGFEVVQAGDGPGLLARRKERGDKVGLLVVSADLPVRSGIDCVTELRNAGDRTPAVIVCDRSGPPVGLDPDSRALVQPFAMSRLVELAAELLRAREEEQA